MMILQSGKVFNAKGTTGNNQLSISSRVKFYGTVNIDPAITLVLAQGGDISQAILVIPINSNLNLNGFATKLSS